MTTTPTKRTPMWRVSLPLLVLVAVAGVHFLSSVRSVALTGLSPIKADDEAVAVEDEVNSHQVITARHPRLPFPPAILEIIKSTNSSQYTWVGNQFIPPAGVPIFTPSQIMSYFQSRNTLFLGDSLSRRFHQSMIGIINAKDKDDIGVEKVDVDHEDYEFEDVNCHNKGPRLLNKKDYDGILCVNVNGSTAETYATMFYSKLKSGVSELNVDNNNITNTTTDQVSRSQRKGVLDGAISRCYHNILWEFSGQANNLLERIKEDYDLVVVSNGIWEHFYQIACRRKADSGLGYLPGLLDNIRDASSKDFQIVFRTTGFATDELGRSKGQQVLMEEFNNYTMEYFHNMTMTQKEESSAEGGPKPNLTLVDFGGVIHKRSFGPKRIVGDHVAHYGYMARLLYTQQLMHELIKADLENYL